MNGSVDTCVWTGHWGTFALPGAVDAVVAAAAGVGATQVLLSPLDGVWGHNPHRANAVVYAAGAADPRVRPAPVLDPTLATWRQELDAAVAAGAPMVRWLPAYAGFDLGGADTALADTMAAAVGGAGVVLWVQTRLEDPRRQHPRAVVPDVAADAVVALASRHPRVRVVLGGATWAALLHLAPQLLALPHCFADTSQVDGMDSLLRLLDAGLGPRLLYGSHAPFFIPLAAVARIVCDLPVDAAAAILHDNAAALFDGVVARNDGAARNDRVARNDGAAPFAAGAARPDGGPVPG